MEILKQYGLIASVIGTIIITAAILILLAYNRPKVYRRIFVWIVLLPQIAALGCAIWNEALRQARAVISLRAKAPDKDTIIQLIDGKLVPEWLVLAAPFTLLCLALLLFFLPDVIKDQPSK
jgi:cytochrome bd-type quinol oxidase subunit 1